MWRSNQGIDLHADEAHNVDDACREAASMEVSRADLLHAIASFKAMVAADLLPKVRQP